jgi:hypothetical protein
VYEGARTVMSRSARERIKQQLDDIYNEGLSLLLPELPAGQANGSSETAAAPALRAKLPPIQITYQNWYSKALPVVLQLLPERYEEFQRLYQDDARVSLEPTTYAISDFLLGFAGPKGSELDARTIFTSKFNHQLSIFVSARERVDSLLADIEGVVQASLFDEELRAARTLLAAEQVRTAGAVAAVVLAHHLKGVCAHGSALPTLDHPSIADYGDSLKSAGLVDMNGWRFIRQLANVADLCLHTRDREPTASEVDDLIRGVERAQGMVF